MKIARVFPRRTKASPNDGLAFFGPPDMFPLDVDEVHVSVAFTWDIPLAECLAEQWKHVAPVTMGGPSFNAQGGEFVSGRYLREGYTITSRGCPNRCWFCHVPKREGELRTLPIVDGHNILDDNILACPESHVRAVFAMLARQKERALFTGGLEARILKPWHVDLLSTCRLERLYCAYDTPDDLEPLRAAGKMLTEANITQHNRKACAYVLYGYPGDIRSKAERRIMETWQAGFVPYGMLWREPERGTYHPCWRDTIRTWTRPAATVAWLAQIGRREKG